MDYKIGGWDGNIVFMGESCLNKCTLAGGMVVLVGSKFEVGGWVNVVYLGYNLESLDHVASLAAGGK